jgi:hypothetical protein
MAGDDKARVSMRLKVRLKVVLRPPALSCPAFASLVMYLPAPSSVTSFRPEGSGIDRQK